MEIQRPGPCISQIPVAFTLPNKQPRLLSVHGSARGSVIGWAGLDPDDRMPPGLLHVAHILRSVKNRSVFFSGPVEDAQLCRIIQLPRS